MVKGGFAPGFAPMSWEGKSLGTSTILSKNVVICFKFVVVRRLIIDQSHWSLVIEKYFWLSQKVKLWSIIREARP
jgi:hypothetical protein